MGSSKPADRIRPNVVVRLDVVNQSARTAGIDLITLHDTEGANIKGIADLQGLAAYFNRSSTQASSHVATDGDGNSSRMVGDERKAWHCAAYNSASLGIEQIGYASQTEWPDAQLRETARWIARWSRHHGIPIRRGAVSNGGVLRTGVVMHSELGALGGGHRDPGPGYPIVLVLAYALEYATQQTKHPGKK